MVKNIHQWKHMKMYMDRHIKYLSDADKSKHKLRESNMSFKEFLAENAEHKKMSQLLTDYNIEQTMGTDNGKAHKTKHDSKKHHSKGDTNFQAANKILQGKDAYVVPASAKSHGFHGQTSSIAIQSAETTEKIQQASKVAAGEFD